jgi:hypothetical protein
VTQTSALWGTLQRHAPKRQWISMPEIFSIIESHSTFDYDDLKLLPSNDPQWKRNVRQLLQDQKKTGRVKGRVKA